VLVNFCNVQTRNIFKLSENKGTIKVVKLRMGRGTAHKLTLSYTSSCVGDTKCTQL